MEIDGHIGTAGHVLLTYKNGGCILTSIGHWIELMKINTNERKLFERAEKMFGPVIAEKMKIAFKRLTPQLQKKFK